MLLAGMVLVPVGADFTTVPLNAAVTVAIGADITLVGIVRALAALFAALNALDTVLIIWLSVSAVLFAAIGNVFELEEPDEPVDLLTVDLSVVILVLDEPEPPPPEPLFFPLVLEDAVELEEAVEFEYVLADEEPPPDNAFATAPAAPAAEDMALLNPLLKPLTALLSALLTPLNKLPELEDELEDELERELLDCPATELPAA